MKSEIQRAEKEADITVIMPQMGVEYRLEPTDEQVKLYHKMIDWGADIIFGGHPHVVEPSEVVKKDGQQKLIIYSMGNFISNQRIETMDGVDSAEWTERGVLMDVTLEKKNGQTTIKTAQAHPTWVNRTPKGTTSPEGYPLYTYQTYILEDFIKGGKYRNKLDEETKERIDTAYKEMNFALRNFIKKYKISKVEILTYRRFGKNYLLSLPLKKQLYYLLYFTGLYSIVRKLL